MKQFTLNNKDKNILREMGVSEEDIQQIERTKFEFLFFSKKGEKKISADKAICLVGRHAIVNGLDRATFHASAVRYNKNYSREVMIVSDTFD